MGIPLFFKKLCEDYPESIIKNIDFTKNNYLFLDLNCAIHPCCRKITELDYNPLKKDIYEKKMIVSVINYIKKLEAVVNPKLVYVAVDGVAPLAKIIQQRSRRFKNALESTGENWDTNAISPGTEFMEKLNSALFDYTNRVQNEGELKIKYVLNDSSVPGEGEHKIVHYLRENGGFFKSDNCNIIVYGLDADLIMLSMVLRMDNVFLLREEVEFLGKAGSKIVEDSFLYLNIDELKRAIIELLTNKMLEIDKTFILRDMNNTSEVNVKRGNFIDDYVAICFVLGNDFIPHTPCLNLRNNGMKIILEAYTHVLYKINEHFIVNNKINQPFLIYFLDKIAEKEDSELIKIKKSRLRFNIHHMTFDSEEQKMRELKNNLPMMDDQREKEKYINIGERGWRWKFYNKCLDIDEEEDIERLVREYFTIFKWVTDYYFIGNVSFYYSYNCGHAPAVYDMVRYLRKWGKEYNINTLKFKKKMVYNSLVQLLCILPKKSWNLLPVGARKTASDSESGIAHYYPETFELDMWFKRYYWQCEPELPLIDIELFKEVAKSCRLTGKERARFKKGSVV
jgi:5'-3' exonuclease